MYLFIIDTDAYAGNFEREMTAYCTGQYGDCEVGLEIGSSFEKEFPKEFEEFESIIGSKEDESCYRPCEIYPTPGRYNNGSGSHFDNDDSTLVEAKAKSIEYAEKYYLPLIEKAKDKISKGIQVEDWTREIVRYKSNIENARTSAVVKYPAYESVAIFFETKPSTELIEFMKKRAIEYSKTPSSRWVQPFNIKGFRMVKEETITTEISIPI